MFTNPLEIVKIRLQTAGEIATGPKEQNQCINLLNMILKESTENYVIICIFKLLG